MTRIEYKDALRWLYDHQPRGVRLGLDRVRRLHSALDSPQAGLPVFHVAGTNGKGSTAALLEAALREEGYRTGHYLSPHLTRFAERIQVRGKDAAEPVVARALQRVHDAAQELTADAIELTFFELVTAAAFYVFRTERVEVAVVEVGLGGRLDATNLAEPVLSVITNVGRDHMDRLGTTPAEIAFEKAGILRPGVPAVTGAAGAALDTIRAQATAAGTPLLVEDGRTMRVHEESLERTVFEADAWGRRRRFELGLLGKHQAVNALLAVRALERSPRFRVLPEHAIDAFRDVLLPGRLERIGQETTWWVDGAHNPDAAHALAAFLARARPDADVHLVFGMLRDKDLDGALDAFAPLRPTIRTVDVPNARSRAAAEVANAATARGFDARPTTVETALAEPARGADALNVVAGSLFLAGEARRMLLDLPRDPIATPIHQ